MKYSECNSHQKKAWRNAKFAASDYIFGLMNGCLDSPKDGPEYKSYFAMLNDIDALITVVYTEAITAVYCDGSCSFGLSAEAYIKDIRFCGKGFLTKVVTLYCKKYQAEALSSL